MDAAQLAERRLGQNIAEQSVVCRTFREYVTAVFSNCHMRRRTPSHLSSVISRAAHGSTLYNGHTSSRKRWRVFRLLDSKRTPWVRCLHRTLGWASFAPPISACTPATRERLRDETRCMGLASNRRHKNAIGTVHLYDSSLRSRLLYEAYTPKHLHNRVII